MELKYDDTNLQKLFADMTPAKRKAALKNAFLREAKNVRKTAIGYLRQAPKQNGTVDVSKEMERGVKAKVWKKGAGFSVTLLGGGKRKSKNIAGKPLDVFFNGGTKKRRTKTVTKFFKRQKRGHETGSLMAAHFMEKTKEETDKRVTDDLHGEIRKKFTEIAKKHGAK